MPKIRLLDQDTVNKIAAGEVIERPASVVKELVENALDAGATRILIEVAEGGKSLVRVTDDGCGIDPEDLPLAFQKHATSKISSAEDLNRIATLGFRGEALSSIAIVARSVEVYTKVRSSPAGTYLRLDEGKAAEMKEAGCPIGTSIAVKDLFYNVPARRKHLKGAGTELAHIAETVTELAIINWGVSFELFTGRRTIFKSNRASSWDEVLLRVFGREVVKRLIPFKAESKGCIITGVAADQLLTRSSPDWIFVYVNGRAVSSKAVSGALRQAYGGLIPGGRSPVAVISMEIGQELMDVNVHPTKREIRFLNEEETVEMLTKAVAEALRARAEPRPGMARADRPAETAEVRRQEVQRSLPLEPGAEARLEVEGPLRLRVLGQAMKLYIVAESEDGLLLIDQHAAAERIRYELLRERYSREGLSQELIAPLTIDLSPKEQLILESWQDVLEDLGFEISPFGGSTYNVRAVPALGSKLESAEALHDILRDLFALGRVGPEATRRDEVLKLLACRGSTKSGQDLSLREMEALLKDLYACQNPMTCPHGRPVAVAINQDELGRLFERV
jgi:DNA mismatch repair protein MutL